MCPRHSRRLPLHIDLGYVRVNLGRQKWIATTQVPGEVHDGAEGCRAWVVWCVRGRLLVGRLAGACLAPGTVADSPMPSPAWHTQLTLLSTASATSTPSSTPNHPGLLLVSCISLAAHSL
jgi:hypothetical protein